MRRFLGPSVRALCVLAFAVSMARAEGTATADRFRLGSDDRVDVRVFSRPDLSLTLKVDGDGNLRLPLLGSVRAAGLTIDEVEASVTAACRDLAGILGPRVTVTVVETAPIFVGGAVQNPGRYPWASDLTPAKAYALAGGPPRLSEGGTMVAFESYRAVEQEELTATRLATAVLRRARLSAEAMSAPGFEPPDGWDKGMDAGQASELLRRERHLFLKRRETLAGEVNNLRRQSQILADQEAGYKLNLEKKGQQRDLLLQEFAAIGGDAETARLVPMTRLLSLKRLIVEVENDQRDIERRMGEAKLQGAITEQTTANLQNARVTEASSQLAEVERELVVLRDSLEPVRRRAEVARRALGDAGPTSRSGRAPTLAFTIRREVVGRVQALEVDADAKLQPRDLVQVAVDTVARNARLETERPAAPLGAGAPITTAAIPTAPERAPPPVEAPGPGRQKPPR